MGEEDPYPIIGELREFFRENGWVIRYESEEAKRRGMFGDDASAFAVPMIAGFMHAKTVDAIEKSKEGTDDGREGGDHRGTGEVGS